MNRREFIAALDGAEAVQAQRSPRRSPPAAPSNKLSRRDSVRVNPEGVKPMRLPKKRSLAAISALELPAKRRTDAVGVNFPDM